MWRAKGNFGFTLIELVIVIVVVIIIAAVVVPAINVDSGKVPPAVDMVRADIQYTQMLAMSRNTTTCIAFQGTSTYTYAANLGNTTCTGTCTYAVANGVCAGTCSVAGLACPVLTRDISQIASGVTVASSPTSILFNSLGEPKGLNAASTITISSGANTKSLTLSPYTGKLQ
jgi:Tfp pilus assembly protein FimT